MQLSEHFSLEEFTRSSTATARGIDNSLNDSNPEHSRIIVNLRNLCREVLEPLRRHLDHPVIISSGYRCPKLNKAVGGVRNSQHMTGEAADIHIPNLTEGREWMAWIIDNLGFDQCIMEHRKNKDGSATHWIHVSFSSTHNRQCVISNIWKK